jgi:hypothetical protein
MNELAPSIGLEIGERLHQVRRHLYGTELKGKTYQFGALLLALLTFIGFLELVFHFDTNVRSILVALFLVVFLSGAVWLVVRPFLKRFGLIHIDNDLTIARMIGTSFPAVQDRLTNFLQLLNERAKPDSLYSRDLLEASLVEISDAVKPIDLTKAVDENIVRKSRNWFLGSVGGSMVLLAIFPSSLTQSLHRLARFNHEFTQPALYSFIVLPGNKEIVKGSQVDISASITSSMETVSPWAVLNLHYRPDGQETFDQCSMKRDSLGVYHAPLTNVKSATEYFVKTKGGQSERYKLTVLDRPVIRSWKVRLEYPAYTRIPLRLQDDFVGDVTALAGTNVLLNGTSNKELSLANVVFAKDSVLALKTKGDKFSGGFRLRENGSYYVELTDADMLINLDPVRYTLTVIPDERPTVEILEPGKNLDIAGSQSVRLLIHAQDDFGFTQLRLGFRLLHSRYQEGQKESAYLMIPIPPGQGTEMEVPFVWNLSKLDLVPEDVVEYFAEVFDNDAVKGPKSARSNVYLLRLPSLEEVFTDIDKGHEQTIDEIKQAAEDAKKLKQDIESINQDMKKNKDIDWQKQKKTEEITKRYQDIQKKLQNVEQQLQQMVQTMDQQNVLSKETMEKYMELQHMLQQMDFSSLQQALKQMQQAMQNVNKEQLQQAMQQVQFSEERFRQGIERTLDLLKRIQIEQKLDEVKKRAEDLKQLQKDLIEETAKNQANDQLQKDLPKKQEDLAKKERELEKEASDVARRMEEFFNDMPVDKLNKLNEQLQNQHLDQQMKNAAQQMRSGQMRQAQQSQQEVQKNLDDFSQQMEALQQEMLQKQSQQVMNELRKATNNLLELSKREETLKQQSQEAPSNSPQLRQNAQDQQRVMQDLNNVVNALSELSKKSFAVTPGMGKSIGEALARMENAMRNLDVRNGQMASQDQTQAMGSLNKAATQVQSALQSMMQGGQGGAGGLMQQLQMMAGQQMSLNMRTQQLGQGMSMEQAAEAARLAKEQSAIQKSLDQLQKEAQASTEQKTLLGDLGKIGEEMKEVIKNLEQNDANQETLKKQERILSRLLDASKSMRERDFEKKRKAQTGTQIVRRSPKDLDLETLSGKNKLHEDLLKALEQGYSKDYQDLIRKYFEELQKTENQ